MDILHEYFTTAFSFYLHTLLPASRPLRSLLTSLYTRASPLLSPILDSSLQKLHDSPSYVAIGALFLVLLVSMQVLNIIRRVLVWWTWFVVRLVFWGVVALGVMVVWQRGVERTAGDVLGWAEEIKGVWWREYRRWEGAGQQEGAGMGKGGSGYAGYGGYGNR